MRRTKTHINPYGLPNIVIPAEALFNEEISTKEAVLFGLIMNLSYNERGYCWASNEYFGKHLGNSRAETISRMISNLQRNGYIRIEQETIRGRNGISKQVRKIFIDPEYTVRHQETLVQFMAKLRGETQENDEKEEKEGLINRSNEGAPRMINRSNEGAPPLIKRSRHCTPPLIKRSRNIDNNNYIDNKKINKSIGEKNSVENKSKPTIKERNSWYLPLVNKLADIVTSHKNVKINQQKKHAWSNEVRKLVEDDGVSTERIEHALDWYQDNIGGQYVPVIESASSLRNKFINLEEAVKRDGGSVKSSSSNKKVPTPKRIIAQYKKDKISRDYFFKNCFEPARQLYNLNGEKREFSAELAETLLDLEEQIKSRQKKHLDQDTRKALAEIAEPERMISRYIDFIGRWADNPSLKLFDIKHDQFSKFRREEAKNDGIQRDPITGNSYLR